MTDRDRYVWHSTPLAVPGQSLDIEYVRNAPWDWHWALVFTGVTCRQELRRASAFTDARAVAARLAARIKETV